MPQCVELLLMYADMAARCLQNLDVVVAKRR